MDENFKEETLGTEEDNLGVVNISDDVISTVVGMTLSEIKGIYASGSNLGSIAEIFSGKKNVGKGVKVSVDGTEVSMDLHVIVEYGVRIPDVAWQAQEKVKEAVESITGLSVDKINIHVEGINIAKDPKPAKKVSHDTADIPADTKTEEELLDELETEMEELKSIDGSEETQQEEE